MELAQRFKAFLSSIEPEDQYVTAAKAAHEKLRSQLRNDEDSGSAHIDTYLSGSYVRRTAIRQIKDVDIVYVVDIDKNITTPETVIAWLQQVMQKYYKKVVRQNRSIKITTPEGVDLDVVPGIPIKGNDGPLWIPDRDARKWIDTHPKGQIDFAQKKNKSTGGYYVQIVKLLKFWRDRITLEQARPKSYVLETLIAHVIASTEPSSHAAAVVQVLEGIAQTYGHWVGTGSVPSISDPGYPSKSVSKRWTSSEFDSFMGQVVAAAKTSRSALEANDEATSIRLWRQLFGPSF